MKTAAIIISVLLTGVCSLDAQIRFDVWGGVSTPSIPGNAGIFINRELPHEEFRFNIGKVKPQLFAGAKAHLELSSPFFVEGGLAFTQRNVIYDIRYTIIDAEHPVSDHNMSESVNQLMLPVNMGANFGAFDITSGFRGIYAFGKKSALHQLSGFEDDASSVQLGWQAGAGYYFNRSRIGLEFMGNFSRVGYGMKVNGQSMELMNVPGHLILSFQQSF